MLDDLRVEAVEPGGGGELVVVVSVPAGQDAGEVLRRLRMVRGRLRGEAAEAIHRKRTPQLVFAVAPAEEEP